MLMIKFIRYLGLILSLSMTIGLVHAQIGVGDYVPPSFTKHERKSPSYINNCPMDLVPINTTVGYTILVMPGLAKNDTTGSLRFILFKNNPYKDNNNDGRYDEADTTILVDTTQYKTEFLSYTFSNSNNQEYSEYFIGFTSEGECWRGNYYVDMYVIPNTDTYISDILNSSCFANQTCSAIDMQGFNAQSFRQMIVQQPQGGLIVILPTIFPLDISARVDLGNDVFLFSLSEFENYMQSRSLEQLRAIQEIRYPVTDMSQ